VLSNSEFGVRRMSDGIHPSGSEVNSQVELEAHEVMFFSDTITALAQVIQGLSQLAGIEGLDVVSGKLQEAADACELTILPGEMDG
jgi:hypothetical protein